jgi:2'-5' RNA ligase
MSGKQLYYVALLPPEPLREEVTRVKHQLRADYNLKHALRSLPHITLVPPFHLDADQLQLVTHLLSGTAQVQASFTIRLNGFGAFGDRVIYIRVDPSRELAAAQESLAAGCAEVVGKKPGPDRPFHPHLTLAHRDLTPELFLEIWPLFQAKTFRRTFRAAAFVLMEHQRTHWSPVGEYPFGNRT